MATALVDLYGGDDFEPFDRIILPEAYRPSEDEEFMCGKHRAYFLRKLKAWKEAIIEESRATMAQLQVDSLREPDMADRASSETDWSIELRTRDRQRKLIAKIDSAIRRLYEGEYGYCEVTGEPISLAMGYFNVIWQRDACDIILRSFDVASLPARIINVTGPERISCRQVCEQFGRLFGKPARFDGVESSTALLSDARQAIGLFGPPATSLEDMIARTADWILRGGETWDKPTHFQVRDGKF